jgi:hypothetical protein
MKNGLSNEYLINLCNPWFSSTGANTAVSLGPLYGVNRYYAGLFIPPYTMQVNRIALPINSSGVQVVAAGMTTDAGGLPAGSGGALNFINSGSTSVFTTQTYSNVSFTTTTLTAGTPYFMAAQTKVYTSAIHLVSTMNNVTLGGLCEYPYNVTTGTATTKAAGVSPMLVGFNNGNYTQWYGAPAIASMQSVVVNSVGFKAGCKFKLNSDFGIINVKAVALSMTRVGGSSSILEIYDSNNTTLLATSSIPNLANLATAQGLYYFHFGTTVILNTNKLYYLRIFTTAQTISLNYSRISGTGLSTSPSSNTEYMNAYDITNNLYTINTSSVYIEYDNARLGALLLCETFGGSFRGTKENGYLGY